MLLSCICDDSNLCIENSPIEMLPIVWQYADEINCEMSMSRIIGCIGRFISVDFFEVSRSLVETIDFEKSGIPLHELHAFDQLKQKVNFWSQHYGHGLCTFYLKYAEGDFGIKPINKYRLLHMNDCIVGNPDKSCLTQGTISLEPNKMDTQDTLRKMLDLDWSCESNEMDTQDTLSEMLVLDEFNLVDGFGEFRCRLFKRSTYHYMSFTGIQSHPAECLIFALTKSKSSNDQRQQLTLRICLNDAIVGPLLQGTLSGRGLHFRGNGGGSAGFMIGGSCEYSLTLGGNKEKLRYALTVLHELKTTDNNKQSSNTTFSSLLAWHEWPTSLRVLNMTPLLITSIFECFDPDEEDFIFNPDNGQFYLVASSSERMEEILSHICASPEKDRHQMNDLSGLPVASRTVQVLAYPPKDRIHQMY